MNHWIITSDVLLLLLMGTLACPMNDAPLEHLPTETRMLTASTDNAVTNIHPHWNVHSGEQVALVLRSNPSTGYSWQRPLDSTLLVPEGLEYVGCLFQPNGFSRSQIVGAGGKEAWVFRVSDTVQPDTNLRIHLVYTRPWEQATTDASTEFVLTVRAAAP